MASETGERAARTEMLHREVNERIRDVAVELLQVRESEMLRLVCECLRLSCSERVELPADGYRAVRASRTRFLVVPGHEEPEVERVVERHPGYVVVEKDATIVERLSEARARSSGTAPVAGSSEAVGGGD